MQTNRKVPWESPINMCEKFLPPDHRSRSSEVTAFGLKSPLQRPLENCQSPIGVQLLCKDTKDKEF